MAKLIFNDMAGVRRLIAHAKAAPDHSKCFGEKVAKPALHFVKDEGIYLMSNGKPRDIADGKADTLGAKSFVVYAKGYDPVKGNRSDVWSAAREAVGGDDFSESIDLADIEPAITDQTTGIFITVSKTKFSIGTIERAAKRRV
jgi:hypothetical protein